MPKSFLLKGLAVATAVVWLALGAAWAQNKPEDTEVWKPVPVVVAPASVVGGAPSDALVLFDEFIEQHLTIPAFAALDKNNVTACAEILFIGECDKNAGEDYTH